MTTEEEKAAAEKAAAEKAAAEKAAAEKAEAERRDKDGRFLPPPDRTAAMLDEFAEMKSDLGWIPKSKRVPPTSNAPKCSCPFGSWCVNGPHP